MAGNKTWHVFRFQHSQGILIKTGKRREIVLRLRHLIPYCASLHKQNSGTTNTLSKEGKATDGLRWTGRKWGKGVPPCASVLDLSLNRRIKCYRAQPVQLWQVISHFLHIFLEWPFHWPKAAGSFACPWLGLRRTKVGSPSQRILRCIFWSKSTRPPPPFDSG